MGKLRELLCLEFHYLIPIVVLLVGCANQEKYQRIKLWQFEDAQNYVGVCSLTYSDIREAMSRADEMPSFVFWALNGKDGILKIEDFISLACFSEDKSEVLVFGSKGIRAYNLEHKEFRWIVERDACHFRFPDISNDYSRAVMNMVDPANRKYIVCVSLRNGTVSTIPVSETVYLDFVSDNTVCVVVEGTFATIKFSQDGNCEYHEASDKMGKGIILGEVGNEYILVDQQYDANSSVLSWMNHEVTVTPKIYSSAYTANGSVWLLGEKGDIYMIDDVGKLSRRASLDVDRIGYGINSFGFWIADSHGNVFQIGESQKKAKINLPKMN